jgi:hypothetical protein
MKSYLRQAFVLIGGIFLLSGCFEAQFDFSTVIKSDGSVERETSIDGRGADLFKAPEGGKWEVKSWETKGQETFLPNTYYHTRAKGKFSPGETVSSDYRFDTEKFLGQLDEEGQKALEEAGIEQPYADHIFSRNEIRVHELNGWLVKTTIYEETFSSSGILKLLAKDYKEEIRKENERTGNAAELKDLDALALEKLAGDILPRIRFHVKVTMPGKIVSSNTAQTGKSTAEWTFSMRDFQDQYSVYKINAVSRSLRPIGLAAILGPLGLGIVIILAMILGLRRRRKAKDAGPKTGG